MIGRDLQPKCPGTQVGSAAVASRIQASRAAEVFDAAPDAAPCKPTAQPREVVRKDPCRFGDGFFEVFLK